jgi:single-strand DNA-binding protein
LDTVLKKIEKNSCRLKQNGESTPYIICTDSLEFPGIPYPADLYAAGTTVSGVIMNNLNSILIEGNLVRDPLYRTTPRGTHVCTFALASSRYFKQDSNFEKEVGFFDVETWGRLAEACHNQGHKGRGVRVVGRLKQGRWNGEDGKPRSRVSIVAEHVEFRPDFKKEETQAANSGYAGTRQAGAQYAAAMAEACTEEYAAEEAVAF